jgi:hypothetical protein
MESSVTGQGQTFFDELRQRRAELRGSISALEHALASPATGGPGRWTERVHVALVELAADLREHVRITEGPDGLYQELMKSAPRLSGAVSRLTREHSAVRDQIDRLLEYIDQPESAQDIARARELGTELIGTLVRHRQRGSDLVYEAYEVDLGGET